MEPPQDQDVTRLLAAASAGEAEARDVLAELTYQSLRKIARSQPGASRGTIQPTLLVHEAYLVLFSGKSLPTKNRGEFYRLAAKVMRDLLVDHSRERGALKRSGGGQRVTLSTAEVGEDEHEVDVFDLSEVMDELAELDERQHAVVELRYFAGLEMREVAEILEVSLATIERDWRAARAWLFVRLTRDAG